MNQSCKVTNRASIQSAKGKDQTHSFVKRNNTGFPVDKLLHLEKISVSEYSKWKRETAFLDESMEACVWRKWYHFSKE